MKLALRLLSRESRAGELTLMFAALVVAVAAVTTVSFFTDRVRQALTTQANQLLAADLVLISDHPIPAPFEAQAGASGLSSAHTLAFPSMVIQGARNQLAEVKGVSAGYPLRGELSLSRVLFGPVEPARSRVAGEADARRAVTLRAEHLSHRIRALFSQDAMVEGVLDGYREAIRVKSSRSH